MPSLPLLNAPAPLSPADLPAVAPAGLYVHVPFCFHKCHYCDFYSITRQDEGRMRRFVDLVLAEADLWRDSPLTLRPGTVFLGGGTPSLLPAEQMARLLAGLAERFDLAQRAEGRGCRGDGSAAAGCGTASPERSEVKPWRPGEWLRVARPRLHLRCASGEAVPHAPPASLRLREFTVEVNPATADLAYLRMLREHGVDRLSFGAQSFDKADLAMLERHHEPADVDRALEMAASAGFERTSIDLIYAIPGQSLASWRATLERAISLGTEHLSCYGLTYEPNTPMAVLRRLGRLRAVAEETELEMFRWTRQRLAEAGRPAYEVSNYAVPGRESLHNVGYWAGESYIGLGPSAASHVEGWRFRNQAHLGRWEEAVSAGRLPVVDVEHLSPAVRRGELAMLNLRLERGIEVADFQRRTGLSPREVFTDQIAQLCRLGLLEDTGTHLRLADNAWHLADAVASEFLQV